MDSYGYRDGHARSPGDRSWGREDSRARDDRNDSFYRGRSPSKFSSSFKSSLMRHLEDV